LLFEYILKRAALMLPTGGRRRRHARARRARISTGPTRASAFALLGAMRRERQWRRAEHAGGQWRRVPGSTERMRGLPPAGRE